MAALYLNNDNFYFQTDFIYKLIPSPLTLLAYLFDQLQHTCNHFLEAYYYYAYSKL